MDDEEEEHHGLHDAIEHFFGGAWLTGAAQPEPKSQGRIKLVADVTLRRGEAVLLVKYRDVRRYDGQTGWFLPDDYLRRSEHPLDAGLRILREQAGVDVAELDFGFVESFEGGADWHIVFHLTGQADDGTQLTPGDNTEAARWFDASALPARDEVAHDGWALDILSVLTRPREQAAQVRSVAE
ncbi:MAG TPA: NUDIX domain-containing protein [Candidatus Dormibacteraeota bacterium]|nr:NUDIX domain-containing protein [Candidatus Dormibacteraeota bacterium]